MFKLRKRAKELGIESSSNGAGGGTFGDTKGRGRKKGSTNASPSKKRKTKVKSEEDDVEVGFDEPGLEQEGFEEMDSDFAQVPGLSAGDISASNHTSEPATPHLVGQTVLPGRIETPAAADAGSRFSELEPRALRDQSVGPRSTREQTLQYHDHGDQGFSSYNDMYIKGEPRSWDSVEVDSPIAYEQPALDTDGEFF